MGIPADIQLTLVPPENGEYYSGDEHISGSLKLKLKKSVPIKEITVHLKGITETQTKVNTDYMMSQNGMLIPVQDNRSYHRLLDMEKRMFPPDNVWDAMEGSSKPFKVNPGEYNYDFKFDKLKGKRPKCLKNHTKNMICFMKRKDIKLPPSFNLKWKELNKIDNLDLFFYSFGKVLYILEVQIELGKPRSWFKPFDKMMRETRLIEYIPNVKDITYAGIEEDRLDSSNNNRNILEDNTAMINEINNLIDPLIATNRNGKNSSSLFSENGLPRTPSSRHATTFSSSTGEASPVPIDNHSGDNTNTSNFDSRSFNSMNDFPQIANLQRYKLYHSNYKLILPHKRTDINPTTENSMWVEVRSKNDGFKQVFRGDTLFKKNCNKFDRVYLTCKGKLSDIRQMSIKPVKIQLNLIENATYLSKGIANENISSLKLLEFPLDDDDDISSSIFNIQELKPRGNDISNIDEDTYTGKSDCAIRFKDHPMLKRIIFNGEDYKHRGNRLYSFVTCSIRRLFYFDLIIDWNIEGTIKQTEIRVDPLQVYCQTRPTSTAGSATNNSSNNNNNNNNINNANREQDFLPRYVEPPIYNEFPGTV